MNVSELRLVVTTEDYDAAVAFYRDTLGLSESAEYLSEDQGRSLSWTPAEPRWRSRTQGTPYMSMRSR
jgi:catechol 2,3-dioxygenase-like lactoylglutathione lyase family enzyme